MTARYPFLPAWAPAWALTLALAALLSACQTLPPPDTHFTDASQIQRWEMSGKLGYHTRTDGGSANFTWHQAPGNGIIHFSGPLGFGSAELTWQPGAATLKTSEHVYEASSPGELAWHLTGFWLPVAALEYWSRGLAWPDAPANRTLDSDGNLAQLQQLGWTLDFDRYQKVGQVPLPHRIKATQADNHFTLLIRDWRPLP